MPSRSKKSLFSCLRALVASFSSRRRTQLILLLGLMLAGALAEMLSIGAVVPFLAVLADPVKGLQSPWIVRMVAAIGLSDAENIRWALTLLFAFTAIASGIIRFVLVYAIANINYGIGHELSADIYMRALYQPYNYHVANNSSSIMGGVNKVDIVVGLVNSLLNFASASLMAIFIIVTLMLINPEIAIFSLLGFGSVYAVVSVFVRNSLVQNSQIINATYNTRVQAIQEGLGAIRDVLLDHAQPVFARRFNGIDFVMRRAQASNSIIAPSPRFAVESIGMVLIALLAYFMTASSGGMSSAIPTLGALALGAQRLMPLLQQVYQGWASLMGNRQVLYDVVNLLQQPVLSEAQNKVVPLLFAREIRLKKLGFRYASDLPMVIDDFDLVIPKGSRIGFIGTTGSGKSTLIDLLMGLLEPSAGQILIDDMPLSGAGRLSWQCNVAHVPQTIFLADGPISENIGFGIPAHEIDMARVRRVARQAELADFIENLPNGYSSMVGERGVRLSGGQRQRIGIARALYKQATLLVFDEATSALDSETERSIMKSIATFDREYTIILIAHRLTTLEVCDTIVELSAGGIKRLGTYQDIIVNNV